MSPDTEVDNNPQDTVRRRRSSCTRCGAGSNLRTVPFRGRYLTLCAGCRVQLNVSNR